MEENKNIYILNMNNKVLRQFPGSIILIFITEWEEFGDQV
jgi:hypothetical protein